MYMVLIPFLLIPILLISITCHEYAHGWVAAKLGDPTPKESGRLTLNPLAHIDPWGTLILPVLLLYLSSRMGYPFTIGYAKPVPINPYHFKNPRKDIRWVGLAGPCANFIIAIVLSAIWRMQVPLFSEVIKWGIFLNLVLGVFNLIPIPPLDGSKVAASFLPPAFAHKYLKIEPYGFFIIILLIMSGFFRAVILPFITLLLNYLLGINFAV
jgi:Zn-dependent protease